jgi:MFS transporter, ACS family, solute carrier family 17 (sodium-dependent inorganic phosphate cotransporter), other
MAGMKKAPRRWTVVGMAVIAAVICYLDRVNISVAIIPMQEEFGWTGTEKGIVLSSFFLGYTLFQIPSGWLANRYGGKALVGWSLLAWSLMTILTPVATSVSFGALIAARILMGAGETGAFPGSYVLFSNWVPKVERSRSVAALLSGLPLGTLLALSMTGPLIARFGWESVFYLFGIAGVVFALLWFFLVHEEPRSHPTISAEELRLIEDNGSVFDPQEGGKEIPWRKIFTNKAVWALITNHFCSNWTFYILLAWLPSYFRDALGLDITQAGLLAMAPWVTMFLVTNLAAWLADHMIARGVATLVVRKAMQIVGLIGAAVFLYLAPLAQTPFFAVTTICGAMGFLAFTWSGFAPNHLEIAPRNSGVLLAITNTAGTVPGVIGVFVTGILLDWTGSYSPTFLLASAICVAGAGIWLFFASASREI